MSTAVFPQGTESYIIVNMHHLRPNIIVGKEPDHIPIQSE